MEKKKTNPWNNYSKANKKEFTAAQRLEKWQNMTDDEKKEYAGPATENQYTNIRCSLSKFTNLVKEFNLDSSVELADSPFKFLLKLKGYELNRALIKELATGFNIEEKSMTVDGKQHKLTLKDFDRILKIGEKDFTKTKSHGPPSGFDSTRFLVKKGNEEIVCMKLLRDIFKRKDNVDDFKRAFALVCLKYVVCAPSRGKLGKKLLKLVEHVDDLNNQPWARLAMDYLVKGVNTFKNPKGNTGKRDLGGSMVFLQLYHFNKLTNKEPEELIKEGNKSSVKFDEETMTLNDTSGDEVLFDTNEELDAMVLFKEFKHKAYKSYDLNKNITCVKDSNDIGGVDDSTTNYANSGTEPLDNNTSRATSGTPVASSLKRKRCRPPKLQAMTLDTPVAVIHENESVGPRAVSVIEGAQRSSGTKPVDNDTSSALMESNVNVGQDLGVQIQTYSSMKGKQGKRRTICINTDTEDGYHNSPTRKSEIMTTSPISLSFCDKLPFKISNRTLWKTIESMEAFRKIPQKPHFRPLESMNAISREGMAIGCMVNYSTVVNKTCALKFEDPIEEYLEKVGELEPHGFDVELIKDRLTNLLLMKEKHKDLEEGSKRITQKLEGCKIEGKRMDEEVGEIEREMMGLKERQRQLLSTKEKQEAEMSVAMSAEDGIQQQLREVGLEFDGLVNARLV